MINNNTLRQAALLAALLAAPGVHAAEVAGVRIEDKVKVGGSELVLNGAGVRSKFFVKVYVGALYVGQKAASAAAIYDSAVTRRMALRMLRDVEADALHDALDEGLRNNHSPAELADLQGASEQLARLMKGIGKAREGDTIAIDFTNEGVSVSLNGELRGRVAAPALSKALLKVWLGDRPADGALKKALLGG